MKQSRRRGAIRAGLVVLGALLLLVLAGGGCAAGRYNEMISGQEVVDQAFSQIDNQYKRRSDLIPQLVTTVKGAAEYEKGVLTEVTEARASVGSVQLPESASANPEALGEYLNAQQGLGSALSRLLVSVERYPELQATAAFRDLQSQIEGTENRIAVARDDYIRAVKSYNTSIRQFPGNLVASIVGFEKMPQLQSTTSSERAVPAIDFGG